jgi:hypothetical protein
VGNSNREMSMRTDLDPAQMTPDERRREVAAILAAGLCRLRDRHALDSPPPDLAAENPPEPGETCLEAARENPLTVHVG